MPVGPDGFFMERHPELGPVETVVDGVFVCGSAVGAKAISDSLAEAGAAAGKAAQLLARDTLKLEPTVAEVDPWLCRGCGVPAWRSASSTRPRWRDGRARASRGAASTRRPARAAAPAWPGARAGRITARHFTDQQIDAMLTTHAAVGGDA